MKPYSAQLATSAAGQELARIRVRGTYQIGGTAEPVRWDVGAPPSPSSPQLPAGGVHTLYLEPDDQVWVAPDSTATATTAVDLWLVWPDE